MSLRVSDKQPPRPTSKLNLSDDAFLGGALSIWQPKQGFRSGIEAIYMAACQPSTTPMHVLEAGCGAGVASLSVAARLKHAKVTGIELAPNMAALADENAARNGLSDRVSIMQGDVTKPFQALADKGLAQESFTHVMANPPFYIDSAFRPSSNALKRKAHMNEAGHLNAWIKCLTALAAPKATLTLIHRADHLDEILALLKGRFGKLIVYPIYPRASEPANRIIVQGIKGSKAPLTLARGMILRGNDNEVLPKAEQLSQSPCELELI